MVSPFLHYKGDIKQIVKGEEVEAEGTGKLRTIRTELVRVEQRE